MSLEMNKIAAAFLTAGVVAMGSGFVAYKLVHPSYPAENAYRVAVAENDGAAPAEEPRLDPVLPLLADADPANGENLYRACASCHTIEEGGANRVGPALWDVVDRQIASVDGFNYSGALQEISDEAWDYEHLNAFIASPRQYAPGTTMGYNGMRSVEDRADLIAYLREQSNDPAELPTEEEIAAVMEEAEAEEAAPEAEENGEAAEEAAPEATEDEATEDEAAGDEAAVGDVNPEIREMIASADPEAGQSAARQCMACHTFEEGGAHRVGPNLYDDVGADKARKEGFNYSDALLESEGEWTYESLWAFLKNPREYAPGTRMSFAGVRNDEDLAGIIAYMRQQTENPPPLD